jgi:hypothetical protein
MEHVGDQLRQEMLLTRIDGAQQQSVFECRTNGAAMQFSSIATLSVPLLTGMPQELILETWVQLGTRDMHFPRLLVSRRRRRDFVKTIVTTTWLDNSPS